MVDIVVFIILIILVPSVQGATRENDMFSQKYLTPNLPPPQTPDGLIFFGKSLCFVENESPKAGQFGHDKYNLVDFGENHKKTWEEANTECGVIHMGSTLSSVSDEIELKELVDGADLPIRWDYATSLFYLFSTVITGRFATKVRKCVGTCGGGRERKVAFI